MPLPELEPLVILAEAAILKHVREFVPSATLKRVGPTDYVAPAWSCWVVTPTDGERDRLAQNSAAIEPITKALAFPPRSVIYQSQETVDRDYEGSWFYAMR